MRRGNRIPYATTGGNHKAASACWIGEKCVGAPTRTASSAFTRVSGVAGSAEQHKLTVSAGEVTDIEPWFGAVAANLSIAAPREDWDALLEAVPRPFYQDLYPATVHHGFEVTGDTAHFCAYYPAIRRLIEIMREVNNAQV